MGSGVQPVGWPVLRFVILPPVTADAAASSKPTIAIEYCTQCRWLPRAAWMAQELLGSFESDLAEVALIPGRGGVFVVRVDGEVVWDRRVQGFPEPAAVKRLVRDRIDPDRDLGHSERKGPPMG
jgi:selenoprotein W-related protein